MRKHVAFLQQRSLSFFAMNWLYQTSQAFNKKIERGRGLRLSPLYISKIEFAYLTLKLLCSKIEVTNSTSKRRNQKWQLLQLK